MLKGLYKKNFANISELQVTLLAVFAFLMPFSRLINVSVVILVLFLLTAIIDAKKGGFKIKNQPKGLWYIMLFFLILSFSLIYTENINKGLKVITRSLPLLLFPIGFLLIKSFSKTQFKKIFTYYIVGCGLSIIFCFLMAIVNYETNPLALTEGFSYFTLPLDFHPSYFSMYIIFAYGAFVGIYNAMLKKRTWLFILSWVLVFSLLIFLKSRAPLVMFGAITFLMIFRRVNTKISIAISILLVASVGYFHKEVFEVLSHARNVDLTTLNRFDIWNASSLIIKENPVLGVGIGDYQTALDRQYYLTGFDTGIDQKFNCHNQYIQQLVSTGIIGLLSLLLIFYSLIRKGIQQKTFLPFYFLICIMILMLFDSVLILQHGVYFLAFFASIFLKLKHSLDELT